MRTRSKFVRLVSVLHLNAIERPRKKWVLYLLPLLTDLTGFHRGIVTTNNNDDGDRYEVLILVLPSVELYDDYVNYPDTSYWGMFFLILLRWIPQIFIYLIDTSIWFACWSAMTGSVVGFQVQGFLLRQVGGGGSSPAPFGDCE